MKKFMASLTGIMVLLTISTTLVYSQAKGLPSYDQLKTALQKAVAENNGGLPNQQWAAVVDNNGVVRAVVYSGKTRMDQWLGSRVIAAQKAFTAFGFSLPTFALSTANLFAGNQPWNFMYGLNVTNPVDPAVAYSGDPQQYGQPNDPLVGRVMGGVCIFGGGLALYNADGDLIGGLGTSGNTSCTDHIITWKVRNYLKLDYVPKGISPTGDDNIIFDIKSNNPGVMHSASGFGHPECSPESTQIARNLPQTHPISKVVSSVNNHKVDKIKVKK